MLWEFPQSHAMFWLHLCWCRSGTSDGFLSCTDGQEQAVTATGRGRAVKRRALLHLSSLQLLKHSDGEWLCWAPGAETRDSDHSLPSSSRTFSLSQQGNERRRILRKQAVPQQRGESSGDLLWSSRTRWKGDSRIPQGWDEPLEMLQCNSPAKGARLFPAKLVLCSVVLCFSGFWAAPTCF